MGTRLIACVRGESAICVKMKDAIGSVDHKCIDFCNWRVVRELEESLERRFNKRHSNRYELVIGGIELILIEGDTFGDAKIEEMQSSRHCFCELG